MMAGGEADVSGAGILDGFGPFRGVEIYGIERRRRFGILLGFRTIVELPFPLAEHAVDAPVDEDSEPF